MVTRYRLKLFPTVVADPVQGDTLDLYFEPIVVLTNPYNAPLRLGNEMWVQLYFEKYYETDNQIPEVGDDWDRGLNVSGRFYKWPLPPYSYPYDVVTFGGNGQYGANYWGNSDLLDYTDPSGVDYRGLNFKLPDITLEPGEVMSFGIANNGERYNGANLLAEGAFGINTSKVILQHKDENGDLLRADLAWSQIDQFELKVPAAAVDIPFVNRFHGEYTCLNPKTGGQIQRTLQPFFAAIGLSDRATPTQAEHYYSFAGRIEVANPNVIARHHWHSRDDGVNATRSGNYPVPGGLYDPNAMQDRSIFFDIALGAGFEARDNRLELSGSPLAIHGYRINNRWIDGHNFRAPQHFTSAADSQYQAPNTLYGGLATYGHTQNNPDSSKWPNFELAKIEIEGDGRTHWGTGTDSTDGLTRTTFFEAPSPELGLLSLGQ